MRRSLLLCCITVILISLFGCAEQPELRDKGLEKNILTNDDLESTETTEPFPEINGEPGLYAQQQVNVTLYFLDEKNNQLSPEVRSVVNWGEDNLIQYTISEIIGGPETSGLKPVISPSVRILSVDYAENVLRVNLSSEFLESGDLVVARAALVNSLTESGSFKYVKLFINGKELTENGTDGPVLGLLERYPNSIADIMANEAKAAENKEILHLNRDLYFQDIRGKYLLPEVRAITVTNGNYAQAIVDELIKGPFPANEGYFPVMPKGTVLNRTEAVEDKEGRKGEALYFSSEFKTQFAGGLEQEQTLLGSLVYSLTTLPQIDFVKIFYQNERGAYIDDPIYSADLSKALDTSQFRDLQGKRVKVYFIDRQGGMLIPEVRAISRSKGNIPERIIAELGTDPYTPDGVRVIPENVDIDDINITTEGRRIIVDLPSAYFDNTVDDAGIIRGLYAIVNSLTDPVNLCNAAEVQFVVDGKTVDKYNDISLKDPFVMNPALTKE